VILITRTARSTVALDKDLRWNHQIEEDGKTTAGSTAAVGGGDGMMRGAGSSVSTVEMQASKHGLRRGLSYPRHDSPIGLACPQSRHLASEA